MLLKSQNFIQLKTMFLLMLHPTITTMIVLRNQLTKLNKRCFLIIIILQLFSIMGHYKSTIVKELSVNGSATHKVIIPEKDVEYKELLPRENSPPAKVF